MENNKLNISPTNQVNELLSKLESEHPEAKPMCIYTSSAEVLWSGLLHVETDAALLKAIANLKGSNLFIVEGEIPKNYSTIQELLEVCRYYIKSTQKSKR